MFYVHYNSLLRKSVVSFLDRILCIILGGILCGSITEIAGESATGKTQFGLQLSLTAQLSPDYGGLDAGESILQIYNG